RDRAPGREVRPGAAARAPHLAPGRDGQPLDRPGRRAGHADAGRALHGRGGERWRALAPTDRAADRAARERRAVQRRRSGQRPRGALPGRVGVPAPESVGGGERRHRRRGSHSRARHRGQDRHRAAHREVEGGLFQNVDWVLLTAACALVLMSVMTLATLSVGRAAGVIAVRQAAWLGVGLLALLTVASLDYRRLVRAAPALYLLGLVGLALVYAFGRAVSGARRWIVLGPLSVQPSELFKVAFVLMTVWVITSRWAQPAGRATLAMTLPIAAVPFVLIIKQPDLGTALLLFPVLMVLLIGAGLRPRVLGGALAVGVAALPLAWLARADCRG